MLASFRAGKFLRSLRVQKVQAVNVDLTPFTDPNSQSGPASDGVADDFGPRGGHAE
jgi:hypothetical protein